MSGEAKLRRSSAVFAGAVRNCGLYLPTVLENLDRFSAFFLDVRFVFAVSDTTDDSVAIIREWLGRGKSGAVLELGRLGDDPNGRTERIACARNACLDHIRDSSAACYDYLVMCDLDNVLGSPVESEGFAAALDWLDLDRSHAGVFANSSPYYYDIWSLRHRSWCPHDCWHAIWGRSKRESFIAAKIREVYSRQIALPPAATPVEVDSAFGGLGIYRMPYALRSSYTGNDSEGRPVSEHVSFNRDISRQDGKLFIVPPLVVQAPQEHLSEGKQSPWWWRLRSSSYRAFNRLRPVSF